MLTIRKDGIKRDTSTATTGLSVLEILMILWGSFDKFFYSRGDFFTS